MSAQENSRHDAEHEAVESPGPSRDHPEREGSSQVGLAQDGPAHDEPAPDGPALDDLTLEAPVHDGMDALLAALLDKPLSEEALRDSEFVAARDAAAGDIALLREQLGLIGDALAGPAAGGDSVAGASPGRAGAARPGDAAGAETDPGRVSGPAAAPTASVTPLSPRPSRARRALKITFGTLAAAAAASVVLGIGWVVVQSGGVASDAGTTSKAEGQAQSDAGGDSDLRTEEGYVACARLIVEGTVAEVEPVPGAAQDRITVEVDRWIKPGRGEDRIDFPMAHDADPRLRKGDHVLIGIPRDSAQPDVWTNQEAEIARDRARMEAALPDSKELSKALGCE
ncbi:hypothetical protein [Streptomyces brasiliscabiei]|uniref:hypothetical protein n=1 Tax=Streptomyces brasiliscabiei TaxID=2736302 RepID=UPI001C121C68|nr:hypothetical protein [Streptomyces brasiliscabiei]